MQYFDFHSSFEIYFSIIKSLFAVYALKEIGRVICKFFKVSDLTNSKNLWALDIIIGSLIVSIFIEYSIFFEVDSSNLQLVSFAFPISGFFLFFIRQNFSSYSFFNKPFVPFDLKFYSNFIFILYFILCLAPITNADSLDYHLGVPQTFIANNKLIWPTEWFHFGLFGKGEYLIYFSMLLKTEHLPTLIQFFSLLSISQLLDTKILKTNREFIQIVKCIVISTPVLLFLMSSPKPQLIGVALSSHVLYWIMSKKLQEMNLKQTILICFICLSIASIKLNFLFSTASLILYFIIINIHHFRKNYISIFYSLFLISLIGIIIYSPTIITKFNAFHTFNLDLIYPVSPESPGANRFFSYLKNYSDSKFPFPISILVPSSLGNISMVLGGNIVLICWLSFKRKFNQLFLPILFLVVISILAGQKTARFFLEPFIWTGVVLVFLAPIQINIIVKNVIKGLCIFKIALLIYGVSTLSRGIINIEQRKIVLENTASGYRLSEWVNSLLDSESKILLGHRSMSLFNQKTYSTDWLKFIDKGESEELYYLQYLKKQNVDYVVLIADDPKKSNLFKYCNDLAYGPFSYKTATRNPFNSGITTTAWIFEANL